MDIAPWRQRIRSSQSSWQFICLERSLDITKSQTMQGLKVNRIIFNLMRFCSSTFVVSVFSKSFVASVLLLVVRCEKRRNSGKRTSKELIPERYDAGFYLDIAEGREMLSQCLSWSSCISTPPSLASHHHDHHPHPHRFHPLFMVTFDTFFAFSAPTTGSV